MIDNTERLLTKLENESKALKATFEQSAMALPVFTTTHAHTTTQNKITIAASGNTYTPNDPERVIVTFNTNSGANTIAKLEISTNNAYLPVTRRIPYSGGAQWSVTAGAQSNGSSWQPTNYTFTVQSLINGTLNSADATT